MLEVSVPNHHLNIEKQEKTTAVVAMPAVGKNVPIQNLLRNAFKMFLIVNGFIQKILVTLVSYLQAPL